MYQLSANIELLFTEAGPDAGDRVRAAAAAGFDAVEMWFSTDKDLDSLAKALADTGVQLTSLLAGPRMTYTYPGTDLAPFSRRASTAPSSTPGSSAARASCSPPAWASRA